MNIEEFCNRFSNEPHQSVEIIFDRWEKEKQVEDFLGMEVGSGLMAIDLMIGDGSLDQVSPELKHAFEALMGEKADSYSKIHQILLEKLENGDASVLGMINKIKGQVGEDMFMDACAREGVSATLANSGSQEGWDVAITQADGSMQYVQVKMYGEPNKVIQKMIEVNEKVEAGAILGENGELVTSIDFAVPKDIADAVESKAKELGIDINIISVNTTASEAGVVVREGFDNMGPGAMENLFGELLGSTLTAAAVHAITNSFLVYKGSKVSEMLLADTTKSTTSSAAGFASGMSVEMILNQVAWIGGPPTSTLVFAASFSTRAIIKRVLEREDSTSWVLGINKKIGVLTERLQVA